MDTTLIDQLVYYFDIFGTAVFAFSGVLVAGRLRMDAIGVIVLAAVTASAGSIAGCNTWPLGSVRYVAASSPAFVARHFADGVSAEAIGRAPMMTFDRKDRLQEQWMQQQGLASRHNPPKHFLPSNNGFVRGCEVGMGWGMHPHVADPAPARRRHLGGVAARHRHGHAAVLGARPLGPGRPGAADPVRDGGRTPVAGADQAHLSALSHQK